MTRPITKAGCAQPARSRALLKDVAAVVAHTEMVVERVSAVVDHIRSDVVGGDEDVAAASSELERVTLSAAEDEDAVALGAPAACANQGYWSLGASGTATGARAVDGGVDPVVEHWRRIAASARKFLAETPWGEPRQCQAR